MSSSNGSAPPLYSEEAERSVLGSILLSQDAWTSVGHVLDADSFARPNHQIIWRAFEQASITYGKVDATIALEVLKSRKHGELGSYLLDLQSEVPSPQRVETYARIVREHALRRQLLKHVQDIGQAAHDNDGYTQRVEALVRDFYRNGAPGMRTPKTAVEILDGQVDITDALTEPPLIVRSGISVLASSTKVGKTQMWLHVAWALTEGASLWGMQTIAPTPVLLIELELTEATLQKRLDHMEHALGWSREGLARFNLWCSRDLQLDKHGGAGRLMQIIQTTVPRPEFVIIDSYNAAISGDPDKTHESRKGLNVLRTVQEQTGVSFGITCEIRKAPPGQKLRYTIDDLKGNNVVAYDADAVVMLVPTDDERKTLKLSFPALRHCEDLPDNLVLHRKGLDFELEKVNDLDGGDPVVIALRDYRNAGGQWTWRACKDELRRLGISASSGRISGAMKKIGGDAA